MVQLQTLNFAYVMNERRNMQNSQNDFNMVYNSLEVK